MDKLQTFMFCMTEYGIFIIFLFLSFIEVGVIEMNGMKY